MVMCILWPVYDCMIYTLGVFAVWGPGYHCIYTLYADRENFKPMDMFESSQARKQVYIVIPET